MNKRWMKVRKEITTSFFFKQKIAFYFAGTGENINQSVWIVIERGRVESMRGYQEVKCGRS